MKNKKSQIIIIQQLKKIIIKQNRMFQTYQQNQYENQQSKHKQKIITIMLNGHPQHIFQLEISNKKLLNKEEIFKEIQKNWTTCVLIPNHQQLSQSQNDDKDSQYHTINKSQQVCQYHNFTLKNLRIFSIDAVQYFDEDLQFLKHGDRLYISNGQQFDNNSNFGQYKILKKLGQGGFGSVQLALNIITNQFAAIKVLKPGKTSSSTDIDMIFKQAQNLKSLHHPNIVKILNCYALSDMRVVIVMEYLQGGQLLCLLKKQKALRFQQKQSKIYFKQIISGIGYCHRKGIIHRDLKLQNILIKNHIQQDGKQIKIMKIADFGISGVADKWNPQIDWGTLRYMSPQVLSGKTKTNTPAVDVWACGIMLYMMLTGKYPFDGNSSSQIYQSITSKPLQLPSNILLTIKCKNILQQLLQKDPTKRITISDIQDHPWININIGSMSLIDDNNYNCKTTSSYDQIISIDTSDRIYNGMYLNQYDEEDLKRITKVELIRIKTKKNFYKSKKVKDKKNSKEINNYCGTKKSGHLLNDGIGVGLIKIPKRLQKQRDEIIEQLKNYKQFRQRNIATRQKQMIKDKIKMRYNYSSQINQKDDQKQSKLFPLINHKKQNKFFVNFNNKKQRQREKHINSSYVEKV